MSTCSKSTSKMWPHDLHVALNNWTEAKDTSVAETDHKVRAVGLYVRCAGGQQPTAFTFVLRPRARAPSLPALPRRSFRSPLRMLLRRKAVRAMRNPPPRPPPCAVLLLLTILPHLHTYMILLPLGVVSYLLQTATTSSPSLLDS